MPNSTKAIIAIVSVIILGSGIFVLTKSRLVENPAISVSSSSVSVKVSSSSKSVLSSSSQVVSSSSQIISKIVEVSVSSKTEQAISTKSKIAQSTICNQLDSLDLVKTEDGCFELLFSIGDSDIFKRKEYSEDVNQNFLYKSENNINLLKEISKDYFKRIKSKFISEKNKYGLSIQRKILIRNSFFPLDLLT